MSFLGVLVLIVFSLTEVVVSQCGVTFQDYTPSCGAPVGGVKGPCWLGTTPGYEDYYWNFSVDAQGLVYEAECNYKDDGAPCAVCGEPINWGETIDKCMHQAS